MEYVSAHATYRFVIRDEEEERARILVSRQPTLDFLIYRPFRTLELNPFSRYGYSVPESASLTRQLATALSQRPGPSLPRRSSLNC